MANRSLSGATRGFLAAPKFDGTQATDPTASHLMDPETGKSLGGRPAGSKNVISNEGRAFALEIVRSPEYRKSLMDRAKNSTLPPNIEAMLWAYAYGRPMERMEITHVTPGAQLTDMSIDELAQRASLIAKVLAEVGDAEAALLAEQMADKARDSRNIAAIDAELVDRSEAAKDPAA